jgi:hypothetical protein
MWWWLAGAVLGVGGAVALASRSSDRTSTAGRTPSNVAVGEQASERGGLRLVPIGGGIIEEIVEAPFAAGPPLADLTELARSAVDRGPLGQYFQSHWGGRNYLGELAQLATEPNEPHVRARVMTIAAEAVAWGVSAAGADGSRWHFPSTLGFELANPPAWSSANLARAQDTAEAVMRWWTEVGWRPDDPREWSRELLRWAARFVERPPCDAEFVITVDQRYRLLGGPDCHGRRVMYGRMLADAVLGWLADPARSATGPNGGVSHATQSLPVRDWADYYVQYGNAADHYALVAALGPPLRVIARHKVTMWE